MLIFCLIDDHENENAWKIFFFLIIMVFLFCLNIFVFIHINSINKPEN